jgi:LPS O-antigen subunit length determinant protein (WzzB/FepE family)
MPFVLFYDLREVFQVIYKEKISIMIVAVQMIFAIIPVAAFFFPISTANKK